jgi:hypothetical protein
MDRVYDFPNVHERPELPDGTFDFIVEGLVEGVTPTAKFAAIRGTFRVTAPESHVNLPWSELFTLGQEGDPDGMDPQKVNDSPGMRSLKRLARACGLDVEQRWSHAQLLQGIMQSRGFTAHLGKSESKKDKKMYTNIDRYYKLGEVPAKLDGPAAPSHVRATATATASAARPNGPVTATAQPATTTAAPAAAPLPPGFTFTEE